MSRRRRGARRPAEVDTGVVTTAADTCRPFDDHADDTRPDDALAALRPTRVQISRFYASADSVRVALGATPRAAAVTVLREACVVTCTGVATGLPAALVTGRALRALLFGVSETDPIILGGTAVLLGVLGLGAALVPARRAAGVDPVVALRAD